MERNVTSGFVNESVPAFQCTDRTVPRMRTVGFEVRWQGRTCTIACRHIS